MHGKRREGHGSIFPPTALLFTRGKELESYGGGGGGSSVALCTQLSYNHPPIPRVIHTSRIFMTAVGPNFN